MGHDYTQHWEKNTQWLSFVQEFDPYPYPIQFANLMVHRLGYSQEKLQNRSRTAENQSNQKWTSVFFLRARERVYIHYLATYQEEIIWKYVSI
jgi:hypothetical protein